MKRIRCVAALTLMICLLATMLPMSLVTAAENGEASLTGIEISSLPRKMEYWTGEALDTTGLTLVAFYSDGDTVEISEGFKVTGFNSLAVGEQTLTVTYMGATTTFTVTVNKLEVIGIEVISLPQRTEYWTGEELDTTGLALVASYSDGNVAEIREGFKVTGFNSLVVGEQTLTVTYIGATTTFTVTVNKLEVIGIEVISLPQRTEYWTGEELDTTGLALVASYSDGNVAEIREGFKVTGFNSLVAGEQTLTVTYMGATTTFTVTVNKLEVIGIEVISLPQKTEYLLEEELDTTGLTLLATYTDGSKYQITEGFTVSGFDSALAGRKTVIVMYADVTTEFTVTIKERYLDGIEILKIPAKTVYWVGEELDTTGLVVLAYYSDGSEKEITEGFMVSGFSSATAGQKNVQIHYGGSFAFFVVTVKKPTVTKIAIATPPDKTEYWVGEALDTTGLTLLITCSDGSTATVSSEFTSNGFNSTTPGQKRVIISYGGKIVILSVTVKTPVHTGIEVKTQPDKTEYRVGEALDTTGLTLTAIYSDGKTEEVTEGFTVTGFDSTTIGEKTVTVTYGEFTTGFTVKVVCPHTQVDNGMCAQCKEVIAATVADGSGNLIGNYITVSDAFDLVASGCTVMLLADSIAGELILPVDAQLDLNGFTLTVNSILTYRSSVIADSSQMNAGVLKITDPEGNMISSQNSLLPVYDREVGGYRFFAVTVTLKAVTGRGKYWFRIDVENFQKFYQLIQSDAQVQIQVKMTWDGQETDVYAIADLAFTKLWADRYSHNSDIYVTVSVTEKEGAENFVLTPGITSGGVEIFGDEM